MKDNSGSDQDTDHASTTRLKLGAEEDLSAGLAAMEIVDARAYMEKAAR
jgi:hypothetical protein